MLHTDKNADLRNTPHINRLLNNGFTSGFKTNKINIVFNKHVYSHKIKWSVLVACFFPQVVVRDWALEDKASVVLLAYT